MKNDFSELESLIDMAEEVSKTVNSLYAKIANVKIIFIFCMAILNAAIVSIYMISKSTEISANIQIGLVLLCLFSLAGFLVYFLKYFREYHSYKQSLETEVRILHRLLNMVYEYKENIHVRDISYVEEAILDIRLQRIRYSRRR